VVGVAPVTTIEYDSVAKLQKVEDPLTELTVNTEPPFKFVAQFLFVVKPSFDPPANIVQLVADTGSEEESVWHAFVRLTDTFPLLLPNDTRIVLVPWPLNIVAPAGTVHV
jgi:hypothetical protein